MGEKEREIQREGKDIKIWKYCEKGKRLCKKETEKVRNGDRIIRERNTKNVNE